MGNQRRRQRRPGVCLLLLAGVLVLFSTALSGPAAARQATPAVPTPVPTLTPEPTPDALDVMTDPTPANLIRLVQTQGVLVGIVVVVTAGALAVLVVVWTKNTETLAARLNVVQSLFTWVDTRRAGRTGVGRYLEWLKRQYGWLDQIGIATEQVQLDLTQVHVPLRVVERTVIEQHRRRMQGETREPELPRWLRTADATPAFLLLSDPDLLAKALEREQQERKKDTTPLPMEESDSAPARPVTTMRLLLLGDAGSGKTTTLRYAALRVAEAYRKRRPDLLADTTSGLRLYLRTVPLPLYIRLTHFAATLPADLREVPISERQGYSGAPTNLFLRWLDREMDNHCGVPPGTLSSCIQSKDRSVLLLLDGLDEAGDEKRRAYIAEMIADLADTCPQHRYVVASRTAGYGGVVVLPGFTEQHLAPLNAEESRQIIQHWFTAVDARLAETGRSTSQEPAAIQTAKLWGVIEHNERLAEMATNPLLVTSMALLQYNNIRLPDQRARLYEKLVELLLDLWRKQQLKDTFMLSVSQLATEQRRIEHLALQMQQQPQQVREVTLAQAQEWLRPLVKGERDEADERIRWLLESLTLDSGLIQRREQSYCFSHYTFQEYLAARALDSLDDQPGTMHSVAFLLEQSSDARWRETLLLAAGEWSNDHRWRKTQQLLTGLLAQSGPAPLVLAAEALADSGEVEELHDLAATTVVRLREFAFDPGRCPDPRLRNQSATLLDRLNADMRDALNLEHPDYWARRTEPGPFIMGDDNGRWEEEKPAFVAHIRRPYALARFPVTNRQYKQFLDALARQGKDAEAQQRRPRSWPGARYRAGEGNHPVVEVSWEDGCAFAAWVNDLLHARGELGVGEEVRLPTEPEWERAAAYPVQLPADQPGAGKRVYPWGDGWDEAESETSRPASLTATADDSIISSVRANVFGGDERIGGTSVVGIFPHGAADCGAEELAGNVWEWCSSPYLNYPLPEQIAAETIFNTKEYRNRTYVLRGGSWNDSSSYARCARRDDDRPVGVSDDVGVRLARLFSWP